VSSLLVCVALFIVHYCDCSTDGARVDSVLYVDGSRLGACSRCVVGCSAVHP